ncbi:FAD-binding oxidoreductase [Rhizobium daejeonense]|uniref:FAD-binding oxidoreductase n=1 Tax=Rhizobium daejeonense TaxID=240521 RepID=A0A6M1S406_9HYPH|nr:FAD-binding oxidoreductase [Rhizobium daejeonense]NGO65929.1 FAD-binding oxidoreductase [Rhizobium daejeonense]
MANEDLSFLPPGVSRESFAAALKEWRAIVGDEYVTADVERLAPYSKVMLPEPAERHRPAGAVAPASSEEVQAVMKVADKYRIPVWMISTGKNLGYGDAAPATAGQVVLDLKRMNRIIEVDETLCYALVEPGVTYMQLKQYLEENNIPLWISFPSSGPVAGPMGNTLDRGVGYNRYGQHFENFCGLEVVLADGSVLRTGMGGVENSREWNVYRWGYGPWVDGLFSQSNFGVVTKMGIWLMPKPAVSRGFLCGWNDDDSMAKGMDVVRGLNLNKVIENGVLGHTMYYIAQTYRRSEIYTGHGAIPRDRVKQICNDIGLGIWGHISTLYGTEEQVEVNLKIAREAFATTGGQFAVQGDPGIEKTPFHHWNLNMTNEPTLTEFTIYNYKGGGGSSWLAPVVRCEGSEVLRQFNLMHGVLDEFGFDYIGGFLIGGRHAEQLTDILYDRNDAEEMDRAYRCYVKMVEELHKAGYGIYRTSTAFMNHLAETYGPAQRAFNQKLKRALDPNGVIAPGKSGINI